MKITSYKVSSFGSENGKNKETFEYFQILKMCT